MKRILILILCVLLLIGTAAAKSSSQLRKELEALEADADVLREQGAQLEEELRSNETETKSVVDRKYDIDRQVQQTEKEMENRNLQIRQYGLLIAEKQRELEQAEENHRAQYDRYRARLRTMEEQGDVSYWSVLFRAKSFSDLLDRIHMIREIAEADQNMLEDLKAAAAQVEEERQQLQEELDAQNLVYEELKVLELQLQQQRTEADLCLQELAAAREGLTAEYADLSEQEAALQKQVMEAQKAYNDALSAEEAARLAQMNQNNAAGTGAVVSAGNSGFLCPVSGAFITDPYGWRIHPTEKIKKFHTGVDFAVPHGTPICAMASGTVSSCGNNKWYGNNVTISHGSGYGSFYGHMSSYVVSSGETVTQGQVIGYVGSTGISTGPHLHFEIYVNGAAVNPMEYVSLS